MRNSRSPVDIKIQEQYQQMVNKNQSRSRSNSPKFHIQELNKNDSNKQREESPSDHKFTLRYSNGNIQYNDSNNLSNGVFNSGTKTRKVGGNSMDNIAPHSSYAQIYNNSNNISPLQGNTVDQSMISLRGGNSIAEREAPQSKAYISAMKALQEKVKILERKHQDSESMHTSELESVRQEKNNILSQSSMKNKEFEDRVQQLEHQILSVQQDSEKQVRVFQQLENNLIDKLKESERDLKVIKEKEGSFLSEIKVRDKEIAELREQLQKQGESKLAERQQLKQKITELTTVIKELEQDKESLKKKIEFFEKQFVQYEKDLILARNDASKEMYIKQLQDQLYQQADFHERERADMSIHYKSNMEQLEKDLVLMQDKVSVLIKENDRLYFDWKLSQDQLIVLGQEKNDQVAEIQKLLSEIHTYSEKSRQQENEQKALQELADQSRKINQQLLENLQKSNSYQHQSSLRLSDLQSSQANHVIPSIKQQKSSIPYEEMYAEDYWQQQQNNLNNTTTPLKNVHVNPNLQSSDPYYNYLPPRNYHQIQNDHVLSHSFSANRFSHSQRMPSRSASQRRLPNLNNTENLIKLQNVEESDPYATTVINNPLVKQYQRIERSPLRNQAIRFRDQEYSLNNEISNISGLQQHQLSQQSHFGKEQGSQSKNISRNRSIDSTIRHSKGNYLDFQNGYSDQIMYEEHYKRLIKDKEKQKQAILEEIDDIIQQILTSEKDIIQLTAERVDLEQEIQEFNGEKIYIDMLKIRLDNVKDKIKKKTDTISYLKRKEQELNKQLKE